MITKSNCLVLALLGLMLAPTLAMQKKHGVRFRGNGHNYRPRNADGRIVYTQTKARTEYDRAQAAAKQRQDAERVRQQDAAAARRRSVNKWDEDRRARMQNRTAAKARMSKHAATINANNRDNTQKPRNYNAYDHTKLRNNGPNTYHQPRKAIPSTVQERYVADKNQKILNRIQEGRGPNLAEDWRQRQSNRSAGGMNTTRSDRAGGHTYKVTGKKYGY